MIPDTSTKVEELKKKYEEKYRNLTLTLMVEALGDVFALFSERDKEAAEYVFQQCIVIPLEVMLSTLDNEELDNEELE